MTKAVRRAAVLIGVDRTGLLPALTDAAKGARRMEAWLADQGLADHRLIVRTDEEDQKVTVDDILSAIAILVDADDRPDQLIVYFAGHGIIRNYSEYWLLSDAPRFSHAAVDVVNSEVLARYCGIPHVVFISDACRTAAEGLEFQRVNGSVIFPNARNTVTEGAIDQFFACGLGQAAAEVRGLERTPGIGFTALYTQALLRGLAGHDGIQVDWSDEGNVGYVRPRALKLFLSREVPQDVHRLGLLGRVNQVPDARITSDASAWISMAKRRAAAAQPASLRTQKPGVSRKGGSAAEDFTAPPSSRFASRLRRLIQEALLLQEESTPEALADRSLLSAQGDEIVEVFGRDVRDSRRTADGSMTLELAEESVDVAIVMGSGLVVQVPVMAGRRSIAIFESGQMRGLQLALDSQQESHSWREVRNRVRTAASEALRAGAFEWAVEDIPLVQAYLARDPYDLAVIVYASTMLDGLRQPTSLNVLAELAFRHWKHLPLDLVMYLESMHGSTISGRSLIRSFRPSLPCLSRNWPRLTVFAHQSADLLALRDLVHEAPWSSFSTDAIPLLRQLHFESSVR